MPKGPRSPQIMWTGIVFFLALSYPFLGMANKPIVWKGIPLLYLYIFGIWLLSILALAYFSRKNNS